MFSQLKFYALIGLVCVLGYFYYSYTSLKEDLADEKRINTELVNNIKNQEDYIKRMTEEFNQIKLINDELSVTKDVQNKKIQTLQDNLSKHDLKTLSIKKPKLVQHIINKATDDQFKCIENITKGGSDVCK